MQNPAGLQSGWRRAAVAAEDDGHEICLQLMLNLVAWAEPFDDALLLQLQEPMRVVSILVQSAELRTYLRQRCRGLDSHANNLYFCRS